MAASEEKRARWARIEDVLDHALELAPAQRRAYLDDACAGDPEVRSEVEALLAADAESDGFLETPAAERAAPLLDELETGQEADLEGRRLGPYEVVRGIGSGGMGMVYEARDSRLERSVALKLLPREWSRLAEGKERFLREARAASALDHPNICTVHDLGETEGGRLYIVMAYYPGETLDRKLERGPLPIAEALTLAIQAGRGLERAHEAGIVHRDVKPANVMVTERGEVKVLDFGIAKIAGDAGLTRTGSAPGTPAYMSPEQAMGRAADHRSDVWSLGAMLYEMIAGRRPFTAEHPAALVHALVYEEPEPLGRRREGVEPALERAVAKALAKDPADRFQSMSEMLAALDPAATTPTIVGAFAPATDVEVPSASRRPGRWAAGAAVLLAAGLAAVWAWRQDEARVADVSEGAAQEIVPYQSYLEGRELLQRGYRRANPIRAIEIFEAILLVDERYAPAYAGLAEAYLWRFSRDRDPLWVDRALESAQLAVSLDPRIAANRVALATVLTVKSRHDEAAEQLDQALRLDPISADAHRELGNLLVAKKIPGEARAAYERAVELRPEGWLEREKLGLFEYRQGNFAAAEAELSTALETAPDNTFLHKNLFAVYYKQGRFEEAAAQLQRSLEIEPLHTTYTNLGTLQFFLGRYRAALGSFRQAIEGGANHHLNWANLGDGYRWTGDEARAREAYQRAIQLLRERLAVAPEEATLKSRLAVYLAKNGKTDEALTELGALGPLDPGDADACFRAVLVYEIAGRRQEALDALRTALEGGYLVEEIRRDPELGDLRQDPRYHLLMAPAQEQQSSPAAG